METTVKEQGIQLLETLLQELISTGVIPIDRVFAPEYKQWIMGTLYDYNEFVQHVQEFRNGTVGFSFTGYTIHETVIERNKFVVRYSLTGTFTGGCPFKTMVLTLFEIENGRFVHSWEFHHTEETKTA
jgi:hypothetical protein